MIVLRPTRAEINLKLLNNNIDKIIPPWYAKEFIRILNSKLMTLIAILVVVLVFINGLMPIKWIGYTI